MNNTHYKYAAERISRYIWKDMKREICYQFTVFFAAHSKTFDPEKFVTACGIDWNTMQALQIELRIK